MRDRSQSASVLATQLKYATPIEVVAVAMGTHWYAGLVASTGRYVQRPKSTHSAVLRHGSGGSVFVEAELVGTRLATARLCGLGREQARQPTH